MLANQIRSYRSSLAVLGDSVVNAILSISGKKRNMFSACERVMKSDIPQMQTAVC